MEKRPGGEKFHRSGHMGVHSIDYCAYLSKLRDVNAGFKAAVSMAALVFCIASDRVLVSLFVMVTMGAVTVGLGRLPLRKYLSFLAVPAAFLILGAAAVAVDLGKLPAGEWNLNLRYFYLSVTRAGLLRAASVTVRALGSVSALFMLVLSTPAGEMIAVLRKIHVPKLMIELMNMVYRFIFIIADVYGNMRDSAESRLGFSGCRTSVRTFGTVAGSLLILSLKKANTYYDALESRGYDGELLFLEEEKPCAPAHVFCALLYFALLLFLMMAENPAGGIFL